MRAAEPSETISLTEGRQEDSQSQRNENQRDGLPPFLPRATASRAFRMSISEDQPSVIELIELSDLAWTIINSDGEHDD
jgi:hypothetical protein